MTELAKRQIGLRVPCELYQRLEKHVAKIGISKPAFILEIIYRELENIANRDRQIMQRDSKEE